MVYATGGSLIIVLLILASHYVSTPLHCVTADRDRVVLLQHSERIIWRPDSCINFVQVLPLLLSVIIIIIRLIFISVTESRHHHHRVWIGIPISEA